MDGNDLMHQILTCQGVQHAVTLLYLICRTKARYHYSIRVLRKREDEHMKTRIAEALMIENNHRDFRKEGKKVEG